MAADIIAEVHDFGPWQKKFRSLIAEGRIGRASRPAAEAPDLHERQRRRGSAGAALLQARPGSADRLPRRARPRAVQGEGPRRRRPCRPQRPALDRREPRARISAASASASAIPGPAGRTSSRRTCSAITPSRKWSRSPTCSRAIASEAEWLADGDDARFMSEVALRLQQAE